MSGYERARMSRIAAHPIEDPVRALREKRSLATKALAHLAKPPVNACVGLPHEPSQRSDVQRRSAAQALGRALHALAEHRHTTAHAVEAIAGRRDVVTQVRR